ncbi:MAG: type II toxin-antitoxin system death-on-curing family toxin [Lysobacteraceae bacterium]
MIIWITRELALAIHERQLAEHGGIEGVRDESLLESALARPQQIASLSRRRGRVGVGVERLADLAASLAYGIARNHPFGDGNKRTAHVCYRVFLALNGVELDASAEDKYVAMLSLAEGSITETEFADWLRKHVAPPDNAVNEPKAACR